MVLPIFCPDCGMMRNRCICGPERKNKAGKNSKNNLKGQDSGEIIKKTTLSSARQKEIKRKNPHIPEKIIENFPFPHPREGQLEIIADIHQALEDGFRYVVLEAGTGTGKSGIATTLGRMYEPAYILTMTKQLQNQYAQEFDFSQVKGRGNFMCKTDDLESSCDIGTCQTTPSSQKFHCPYGVSKSSTLGAIEAFEDSHGNPIYFQSSDHCHYWDQKADAVNSPITLMNYDYALLELNHVGHFGSRKLLILDEAHNIEDKLMRRLEVTLSRKRVEKDIKKGIPSGMMGELDPEEWILQIDAISDAYKDLKLKDLPKNKADRINRTIFRLDELKDNLAKEPKNWVMDTAPDGVSFKPLRVHHYAYEHLFRHADACIFLSATILSHQMFCRWLGMDPREVYFVKVDSPFPPSKRPIELKLAGKMSKNRIKRTAPDTLPILTKILKRHRHDKGLIHTHNYQCQKYIMNKLPHSRLMDHNSMNRETVLHNFETSHNPLVLISPSMSEGVDLPYDKCRFQVIYKVPFPYLGDKQVNMRRKRDQRWYAYKTVMTLMQAYGRGMRAEDDECYTYILDENIKMLFNSPLYRSLIPEFFKEAVIPDE
ncbi:MAG: ATP-dependent helicase [Methanobacterium sp.]|nr:MAG: ATP-dependent helicase [Methanobacterium sp.]